MRLQGAQGTREERKEQGAGVHLHCVTDSLGDLNGGAADTAGKGLPCRKSGCV